MHSVRHAWAALLNATPPPGAEAATAAHRPLASGRAIAVKKRSATLGALIAEIATARAADTRAPPRQAFDLVPVPKPRQTQRDRWVKRPPALRHRALCDELRLRGARLPHRYALVFVMPMPASWSARKRAALNGQPHLRRPDLSNLHKACEDGLVANDEALWSNRGLKVWGYVGRVLILLQDTADDADSDATFLVRAGVDRQSPGADARGIHDDRE